MTSDGPPPGPRESRESSPAPGDPHRPVGFRRFLLAIRPGEAGPRVWEVVGQMLRGGAEGVVCYVVLRSTTAAANETDGFPANAEETAVNQELRARLLERLGSPARDIPIRILHGDPGQRICEYADYAECELVVLARRERSSFGRWARGSVSRYVAATFRRSVLLVGD